MSWSGVGAETGICSALLEKTFSFGHQDYALLVLLLPSKDHIREAENYIPADICYENRSHP